MAQIVRLEKFKGELNGVYQTLWVAISETGNVFTTSDLELKQEGTNDIKGTKWKSISNEHYSRISDEMHCVSKEDYQKSKSNPKHFIDENKGKQDKVDQGVSNEQNMKKNKNQGINF